MAVLPPDKPPLGHDYSYTQRKLSLQSSKTSRRLNQIDRIRANGVGDHIALPQLVVCGDQSAGKSSVLEGISGIPFPRQDGLCTRFATEIILRHESTDIKTTATIIPHSSRSEEEKRLLSAYHQVFHDFAELPNIIEQAAKLMGVRGIDAQAEGPAFAADVLRLELVGDTGLHLTIVDLPGLISVAQSEEDVKIVEKMVDSYLQHSRTIILAVIPATSDVDTQGIIQRARRFDEDGIRTVGIITKPDLINAGTEARIARLAKNCDRTKLTLGFFILKNPSPTELKAGMTTEERRKTELAYFSTEVWKKQGLDPSRVGVDKLRCFLEEILDSHIERELPKVRDDIRRLLREKNEELDELGAERKSPNQIRMFLTKITTNYYNVIQAGVDGSYGGRDASFFEIRDGRLSARLRAAIHIENEKFSDDMRQHGENRKIVSSDHPDVGKDKGGQHFVTKEGMLDWIRQVYDQTRGQELPGNYNQALLAELFHVQSLRWAEIAREHIFVVSKIVFQFVNAALAYAIKDGKVRENIGRLVSTTLEANVEAAEHELERILQDETRQPITYNHYYTDNIQKARNEASKSLIEDSVRDAIHNDWDGTLHLRDTEEDCVRLLSSLKKRVIVDMKEQACSEAKSDLTAYYKVARKTFVDNVCRQVIERHILARLADAFSPMTVSLYSEEELINLAIESPQICHLRSDARRLQAALEQSLRDLAG
ncbi:Dynamin [Penicillium canescens]|uniref:Dynamin n=1 Tax=Penicillium canescens TaxID=5083 RepID=A0AAD6N7A0_PENCN|nr:Dynamin [Penicillium canescens]KAJ6038074.1 Dynamin [Penicillium canescens]KAJ6090707.1 Dynamin [Penicillium canescens]KAJ6174891.1 Dynamin [Penicillium canescens]